MCGSSFLSLGHVRCFWDCPSTLPKTSQPTAGIQLTQPSPCWSCVACDLSAFVGFASYSVACTEERGSSRVPSLAEIMWRSQVKRSMKQATKMKLFGFPMVNGKIQLLKSEKFPSKILVFAKAAFAIRKIASGSLILTKPCFTQLQSSRCSPGGCQGYVFPSWRGSTCWTWSATLPVLCDLPPWSPPGFLMPQKTIWETTLRYTWLYCGGT